MVERFPPFGRKVSHHLVERFLTKWWKGFLPFGGKPCVLFGFLTPALNNFDRGTGYNKQHTNTGKGIGRRATTSKAPNVRNGAKSADAIGSR
jgi:hypothetical protein